jgi:NitT/TauT family transport system substrate-binding protein
MAIAATAGRLDAQTPDALKIGVGLIESHAEGYYALDGGFFAKRGLLVEVQSLRNGSTIAAAVASGDLQAGCSTVLQLVQARGRGVPFVILAAGSLHDSRFAGTAGLMVAASSHISAPKELDGKVIATSTLNGLDQLETAALIDKDGGDSSTLKFIELSPRLMADALEGGRVDAASMEEPELSAAGAAIRSVGDGMNAISKRFVSTVYFTTADWLAANPGIARRFSEAIFAAGAWAMANPESAAAILQKRLGVSIRPSQHFATRNDRNEIAPLAHAAVQYKYAASSGLDILRDLR